MKNELLINELSQLLEIVENYEQSMSRMDEIEDKIHLLYASKNNSLEKFDSEYLPKYILDQIGEAPKDFAQLNPIKLIKPFANKKRTELQQYYENKEEVTKQYYTDFAEQRAEIIEESQAVFNQNLLLFEREKNELDIKIEANWNQLNQKRILPERFVNSHSIKNVISYLEDYRADTLKEAISILCFEEKLQRYHQELSKNFKRLEKEFQTLSEVIIEKIEIETNEINLKLEDLSSQLDDLQNK